MPILTDYTTVMVWLSQILY